MQKTLFGGWNSVVKWANSISLKVSLFPTRLSPVWPPVSYGSLVTLLTMLSIPQRCSTYLRASVKFTSKSKAGSSSVARSFRPRKLAPTWTSDRAIWFLGTKWLHTSSKYCSAPQSVENTLLEAERLAQTITPELRANQATYDKTITSQLALLDKALQQSLQDWNMAADKTSAKQIAVRIFISLIKSADAAQRTKHVVKTVKDNIKLLFEEESVLAEIPGLYAEAIWTLADEEERLQQSQGGLSASAQAQRSTPSAFITAQRADAIKLNAEAANVLHDLYRVHKRVPAEPVVVAFFNLALMQQASDQIDAAIASYKRASAICQQIVSEHQIALSTYTQARSQTPHQDIDSSPSKAPVQEITDETIALIHANLATLLLDLGRKSEAIPVIHVAVDCRERLLKQDVLSEQLRNDYVSTIEALSAVHLELGDSESSRRVWERASLMLEYGGDTAGWLKTELQASKKILDDTSSQASPREMAAVRHRHAKALIACNTADSLANAVEPLKLACETYRHLDDKASLLDALEDLSNAYESMSYNVIQSAAAPSSATSASSMAPTMKPFVDEQSAVFGECLSLSESLHGAFYLENARYLNNLAIFAAEKNEAERARNLVKAALYICEKVGVDPSDSIYATTRTLHALMGLSDAAQASLPSASSNLSDSVQDVTISSAARSQGRQGKQNHGKSHRK